MKVVKRNGSLENYSPEKIKRVVMSAGLDEEQADELVGQMTEWVAAKNGDNVTSIQLRDEIINLLKEMDQKAADYFQWYQNSRDKNSHN